MYTAFRNCFTSKVDDESRIISKKYKKVPNRIILDKKIPRNSICPCGSGKKYKHCHGK